MPAFYSEVVASGRVKTDGTINAAGYFAKGAAIARTGAGVYTITLDRDLDSAEGVVLVTPEASDMSVKVVDTSDTVKTVTCRTGAANTDSDFKFAVVRTSGGSGH